MPVPTRISFHDIERTTHGAVSTRTVNLGGSAMTEVTFGVGAVWSKDIGAEVGASFCQRPHTGVVLAGRLGVRMRDGHEEVICRGDAMFLPPGHEVWTVGASPCVFIEFSEGTSPSGHVAGAH